jgi:hypothetical protein
MSERRVVELSAKVNGSERTAVQMDVHQGAADTLGILKTFQNLIGISGKYLGKY